MKQYLLYLSDDLRSGIVVLHVKNVLRVVEQRANHYMLHFILNNVD